MKCVFSLEFLHSLFLKMKPERERRDEKRNEEGEGGRGGVRGWSGDTLLSCAAGLFLFYFGSSLCPVVQQFNRERKKRETERGLHLINFLFFVASFRVRRLIPAMLLLV